MQIVITIMKIKIVKSGKIKILKELFQETTFYTIIHDRIPGYAQLILTENQFADLIKCQRKLLGGKNDFSKRS